MADSPSLLTWYTLSKESNKATSIATEVSAMRLGPTCIMLKVTEVVKQGMKPVALSTTLMKHWGTLAVDPDREGWALLATPDHESGQALESLVVPPDLLGEVAVAHALTPSDEEEVGPDGDAATSAQAQGVPLLGPVLATTAAAYHESLLGPAGKDARAYLKDRGVTSARLKADGFGWATDDQDSLFRHLMDLGYSMGAIEDSGVCVKTELGDGHIADKLRSRVVVPIIDAKGDLLGLVGRLIEGAGPEFLTVGLSPKLRRAFDADAWFTACGVGAVRAPTAKKRPARKAAKRRTPAKNPAAKAEG